MEPAGRKARLWTRATPKQDPVPLRRSDAIRHGIWLGVLSDLLASVLFWLGVAIYIYLTEPPYGEGYISFEAYILALTLGTFVALLLPTMAGGALVAWVLYRRRNHPQLALIAILSGAGTAWALVSFVYLALILLTPPPPPRGSSAPVYAWLLAVAVLTGGSHGWRMARWLRRQEPAVAQAL